MKDNKKNENPLTPREIEETNNNQDKDGDIFSPLPDLANTDKRQIETEIKATMNSMLEEIEFQDNLDQIPQKLEDEEKERKSESYPPRPSVSFPEGNGIREVRESTKDDTINLANFLIRISEAIYNHNQESPRKFNLFPCFKKDDSSKQITHIYHSVNTILIQETGDIEALNSRKGRRTLRDIDHDNKTLLYNIIKPTISSDYIYRIESQRQISYMDSQIIFDVLKKSKLLCKKDKRIQNFFKSEDDYNNAEKIFTEVLNENQNPIQNQIVK